MRVTYIARAFLDYRVPVFEALQELLAGGLRVIYSADHIPARVDARVQRSLGAAAVPLVGERRIGLRNASGFANRGMRLVYQPGIWQAIRTGRPQVIVGDGFYQWSSFGLIERVRAQAALVIAYERTRHTERNAQWYRLLYRRAVIRFVDAMTCSGSLCRSYAVSLGMPADRITLGHMVADSALLSRAAAAVNSAERDALRNRWGNPDVTLVAVGRLNERKGVNHLLTAWAEFEHASDVDVRLLVIGDGPDRSELQAQADRLGIRKAIFVGHVDYSEIARYYASADALIVPTLEDNWSLVVPEAMACGLPILCSVYNGCHPELVKPGINGWIFDPLDIRDFVAVLGHSLEARANLGLMGGRSREIAARFTPESAARAIADACELALKHRTQSSHRVRETG